MKIPMGIVVIFVSTFFLVFTLFTMVEPSLACSETEADSIIPRCNLRQDRGGDFVLGVMLVSVLGLLDMGMVYQILGDFLL